MKLIIIIVAVILICLAFLAGVKVRNVFVINARGIITSGVICIATGCAFFSLEQWRDIAIVFLGIGIILIAGGFVGAGWEKKKKYHEDLDILLINVANNVENNYKDAAQKEFKKFLKKFDELSALGKLNEKQYTYYDSLKKRYQKELKDFHH